MARALAVILRDGDPRGIAASDDLTIKEAVRDVGIDDPIDSSAYRDGRSRLSCQLPLGAVPDGLIVRIAPEE